MSNNQKHGKSFEDLIKINYSGSSDHGRLNTSRFDIESKFDKDKNLPTSVKTTKSNTVCLSDARRIFSNNEPHRIIVGKYEQNNNRKAINEIYEIIVNEKTLDKLKGNLDFKQVEDFHNSLKNFKKGEHTEARDYAKKHKQEIIESTDALIQLNAKIDSKTQRRLQCSIGLDKLIETVGEENVIVHTEQFGSIGLPVNIISPKRNLNDK